MGEAINTLLPQLYKKEAKVCSFILCSHSNLGAVYVVVAVVVVVVVVVYLPLYTVGLK